MSGLCGLSCSFTVTYTVTQTAPLKGQAFCMWGTTAGAGGVCLESLEGRDSVSLLSDKPGEAEKPARCCRTESSVKCSF